MKDEIFIHNLKRISILPRRSVTINDSLFSKAKIKDIPISNINPT